MALLDSMQLAIVFGHAWAAMHELSTLELPADYRRLDQVTEAYARVAEALEIAEGQLGEWLTTAGKPDGGAVVPLGDRRRKQLEARNAQPEPAEAIPLQ